MSAGRRILIIVAILTVAVLLGVGYFLIQQDKNRRVDFAGRAIDLKEIWIAYQSCESPKKPADLREFLQHRPTAYEGLVEGRYVVPVWNGLLLTAERERCIVAYEKAVEEGDGLAVMADHHLERVTSDQLKTMPRLSARAAPAGPLGESFFYRTLGPVKAETRAAIFAEVEKLKSSRDWWKGTLILNDVDQGVLEGDTDLFHLIYKLPDGIMVDVETIEDDTMSYRDMVFILDRLSEWSLKYQLRWVIAFAGSEMGTIEQGKKSESLRGFLAQYGTPALKGQERFDPTDPQLEQKAVVILKKHAARKQAK